MTAGMLARRLGYLTDDAIRGVTQTVLSIALPCLTIYNMRREFCLAPVLSASISRSFSGIAIIPLPRCCACFSSLSPR